MQFIVLNCFVNVMPARLEDERVEFKEAPNKEVMQFARSVIWTKVPGVVETTCHRDGFSTLFFHWACDTARPLPNGWKHGLSRWGALAMQAFLEWAWVIGRWMESAWLMRSLWWPMICYFVFYFSWSFVWEWVSFKLKGLCHLWKRAFRFVLGEIQWDLLCSQELPWSSLVTIA